jgi:restriction system protein
VTDAGRALGASGDNGIDGVIDQDPLGLDRVYIQAKRYGPYNPVGSGAVRDFFGVLTGTRPAKVSSSRHQALLPAHAKRQNS